MLEGRELRCVRDRRVLFEDLSLRLEPGDLLQVEGPNGAGKTSLLRILCGLSQPRAGFVYWDGADIRGCRAEYHQELLYSGHNPGIKEELTAVENLRFFRTLGGHEVVNSEIEEALDRVGLYGYEDVEVRAMSAGQRRRVGLARLWLSTAKLWVLDEPFTAIDREGIHHLENRVAEHAEGGGMAVLTTHQALHRGKIPIRHLRLG